MVIGIVNIRPGSKMSTYQHRISFKGTEDSIDYFTKLLRDLKTIFGVNSAEILLGPMSYNFL
jgi:hypothetical protein